VICHVDCMILLLDSTVAVNNYISGDIKMLEQSVENEAVMEKNPTGIRSNCINGCVSTQLISYCSIWFLHPVRGFFYELYFNLMICKTEPQSYLTRYFSLYKFYQYGNMQLNFDTQTVTTEWGNFLTWLREWRRLIISSSDSYTQPCLVSYIPANFKILPDKVLYGTV
jgi:hypothetical protein